MAAPSTRHYEVLLPTASGDNSITGVRATATAAGTAGTPKIDVSGIRGAATATGTAGTPKLAISTRASATATGTAGTPKILVTITPRALATAAAAGTPMVSLLGVRALATAAGTAGTPKVLVTGTRALATAAGKAGTVSISGSGTTVTGVRAEATTTRYIPDLAIDETTTFASGENNPHSTLVVNGDLFIGLRTTPAKVLKWSSPDTDLATYSTLTFAGGNQSENNADSMIYLGGSIYVVFTGYFHADDTYHFRIHEIDPSAFTQALLVDQSTGRSTPTPGTGVLGTDGTDIYYMSNESSGTGCQVFKFDTSGTLLDSIEITGRLRGHTMAWDSANNRMRIAGEQTSTTTWAGWVAADLATFDTVSLSGSVSIVTDDSALVGTNHWIGDESSSLSRVAKVSADLATVSTFTTGMTSAIYAVSDDGRQVWLAVRGTPGSLVAIDRATSGKLNQITLDSGDNETNEVIRDGNNVYATCFLSPGIALRLTYSLTASTDFGAPKVDVSGRVSAAAAGTAGTPLVGVSGARALAAATGTAGTPKVDVTGVRALATATGTPGTVDITESGSPDNFITGVRAEATAAGRAGTPKVDVSGRCGATAAGTSGTPKVDVSGRAGATASGTAGTPRILVPGTRAAATAAATAGTPKIAITIRAEATAAGTPGTPKILVTGVRALATAAGKAGSISAPGNRSVTGVRALATAVGREGTPKIQATGARAACAASGTAGTPKVAVTGVRAAATAAGKAGTVFLVSNPSIAGTRALCTAAGTAGTPKVACTGARATAAAAGRAGTPKVGVSGRASAACAGRPGTPKILVTGARAVCAAAGNPGITGIPGLPVLTRRTRTFGPNAVTILATRRSRTRVTTAPSRTISHTPETED